LATAGLAAVVPLDVVLEPLPDVEPAVLVGVVLLLLPQAASATALNRTPAAVLHPLTLLMLINFSFVGKTEHMPGTAYPAIS
jgi:hypothetical protein